VIVDAALNVEIAEVSERGFRILKPFGGGTGQASSITYQSTESITDLAGRKTGYLKFVNEDGAVVAVLEDVAKGGTQYSDDLVKAAQKLYPKKAGKIELHHPIPRYLGGAKNQTLVPLDRAYHQVITNEFRKEWGYGRGKPNAAELQQILNKVYSKYPLPDQ
jgi:hypothetical protein